VVGSGPNGLAAAVTLARAGLSVQVFEAQPTIGGGARPLVLGGAAGSPRAVCPGGAPLAIASPVFVDVGLPARGLELTRPDISYDVCSAVHPLAIASPFFVDFELRARRMELTTPEIAYAQPLDGKPAALAFRDLETTVDHLGEAGPEWRRFFAPLLDRIDDSVWLSLGDKRSVPETLRDMPGIANVVKFGLRLLSQAGPAWNIPLSHESTQALFTGVAAHAIG